MNNTQTIPGFTRIEMGSGIFACFTSRYGGVSAAPWDSLNLGPNVNDDMSAVAANRRIVAEAAGAPIAFASQVHGNNVILLSDTDADIWHNDIPPITAGEADGLVSFLPNMGLGVLVADCVPIILASANAIAIAHAGRRGIELDVIQAVINQMQSQSPKPRPTITAAIGPAICGKCYEVPLEMQNEVCALEPSAFSTTSWGTPGLDLPTAAKVQLERAGAKVVYQSPICTFESPDHYSHRRATAQGTTTGRQAGIIARIA